MDIIKPLQHKDIPIPDWFKKEDKIQYWNDRIRLLFFDPIEVYNRAEGLIDHYQRNQSKLSTAILFPKRTDGICRCGCGKDTVKMWYSQNCANFAYRVYSIICYGTAEAKKLMSTYYGDKCQICNNNDWEDIDHIIPVKHGGGGCWLGNFLPVCKSCHKDKTNKDFKWKEYKQVPQLKLDI